MGSARIGTEGTLQTLMRLASPVLVEQLLSMLVGLVDTWLAGQYLDEPHLAAIGLMSYVLWMLPSMFAAVAIGATAVVARLVGAGEWERANQATHQALLLGGVAALVMTCAAAWGHVPFVHVMRLSAEATPLAIEYSRWLVPVVFAVMVQQVGVACLHGAGDTVTGFIVMTIVNAINVCVSAALVIGIGGAPKLGWSGLAIGTATAHVCGGLLMAGALLVGRAGLRLSGRSFRPDFELMRRLLRVGLPGGFDVAAVLACHLWYAAIINALGTAAAAAHGVGVRIESLSYLPGYAFHVAAATMVGQSLGSGDPRRAVRSVWAAFAVGGSLMSGAGLLFYFGGAWLTRVFLGDQADQVSELTIPLLKIVSYSAPALALTMVLTGGLRGAGDTRGPLAITFIGLLGVRIPLAYWLAYETLPDLFGGGPGWGWGVIGAWWGMVIDTFFRAALTLLRFLFGRWRELKV